MRVKAVAYFFVLSLFAHLHFYSIFFSSVLRFVRSFLLSFKVFHVLLLLLLLFLPFHFFLFAFFVFLFFSRLLENFPVSF